MRLLDYPGLFHVWPPRAHDPSGKPVRLEHGLDTLIFAFAQTTGRHTVKICILTEYHGILSMREITDAEEIFARVFCDFLNRHRKMTVREIGEIDVSFLG